MTTIVSAMFGGFDTLRRQADQSIDVDWVMFTDQGEAPPPWRVVHCEPSDDPRMAAKRFKCTPPFDGDVIWIDASMEVIFAGFAQEALAARNDGVAVFDHPRRNCIYAEAAASQFGIESQHGKYDGFDLVGQADSYRDEYPVDGGLFACGVVAWDFNDERARRLGAAWLAECERWSPQDQISFPVVARRMGIKPGVFPMLQQSHNRWLWIHNHR